MFYINEQQDAELRFGERKDGETSVIENASQANIPQYITRMQGDTPVKEANTSGYENIQHLDVASVSSVYKDALFQEEKHLNQKRQVVQLHI